MPGAGMVTKIEEVPRCRKALVELREASALLLEMINTAEVRFITVLGVVPSVEGTLKKNPVGTTPPMMLADEIYEAARVIGCAADRVRSLVEQCEL